MKANNSLKVFLEVSNLEIAMKNSEIKKLNKKRNALVDDRKNLMDEIIAATIRERDALQGRLDSVKLEILDMFLDDESLVSVSLISKKGYNSVIDFVTQETKKIKDRKLYMDNPFSIEDVLKAGLIYGNENSDISLFEEIIKEKVTDKDIKDSVSDKKVVKALIKTM